VAKKMEAEKAQNKIVLDASPENPAFWRLKST
jgi:hypothetical protein